MKMILALMFVCGSAVASEVSGEPRRIYRLDFAISENEDGKPPSTTTCTLNLEEKRGGEIKLGSNISLPKTNTRADIGLMLHASFTTMGEDLLVDDDVEITAAKDPQTFRKLSAKGNALVTPGKPALVASVEDPISHKRYQVTLTASKLR